MHIQKLILHAFGQFGKIPAQPLGNPFTCLGLEIGAASGGGVQVISFNLGSGFKSSISDLDFKRNQG